jgi:hypothetical protein
MMVQRILNILAESKSIWPLATRWYDHLERFYTSQNAMPAGTEGSMADSVSTSFLTVGWFFSTPNTSQREPIPHVLHPPPNHPAVKPIQPRVMAPTLNENGVRPQCPSMTALTLQQQQQQSAPTTYTDPSLGRPASQPQVPLNPPPQQPQQVVMDHGQAPLQATGARPTTDGLGLLIEAFDARQSSAAPVQGVQGVQGVPGNNSAPPPPGAAYDPHATPQQYYPQPALAVNDGYENELGYYMSDGVPPAMQQNWAGGGDMYGY